MDVEIWGIPDLPETKIQALRTRLKGEIDFYIKNELKEIYIPCDRARINPLKIHVKILVMSPYRGPILLLIDCVQKALGEHFPDAAIKCELIAENVLASCR